MRRPFLFIGGKNVKYNIKYIFYSVNGAVGFINVFTR